jgi:Domain of unknown function (DUF5615)
VLCFLRDEHLRGPLWLAIVRHNMLGGLPVDAVRVGDPVDLPLGSDDSAILRWAEREGRILLTEDVHTMPGHLAEHLQAGGHTAGVFVLRTGCPIGEGVSYLELVAHAGEPTEYADAITYVP